jgi:chromosomal replication initiator protein
VEPELNQRMSNRSEQFRIKGEENDAGGVSGILITSVHPWDGYLTGPENELAMAAAQVMATGKYNGVSPLVIYGLSGVGKSRLLAGLVVEWLQHQHSSSVAHLDTQAFVRACFEAAAEPGGVGWLALRRRFRSLDLFVLEDIEGLERVPWVGDELAHTLDALEAGGAAVVVSAQTPPATWVRQRWPQRLVNRLKGGLTAQITPPGLRLRHRYVLQCISQCGVALEAAAVEALAEAVDGYRSVDGWISRLTFECRLKREQAGREVGQSGRQARENVPWWTLDSQTVGTSLAAEALLLKAQLTIAAVARAIADRLRIRLSILRGPSRRASVVAARHIAMHLARTLAGSSFAAIGTYFGGRDPSSVRYACKMTAVRLATDPIFAASIAGLSEGWQQP